MSSGKRAYTTLASCVSKSLSTNILPILIDLQQSLSPCSIASPLLIIETYGKTNEVIKVQFVKYLRVPTPQLPFL